MTFTDVAVVLSFLAIVVVVAKMLRALRLLEARVTLLQEQVERNHGAVQKVAAKSPAPRPPSRTPVVGVPVTNAIPRSPSPDLRTSDDARPRADSAQPTDDEIAWAWLEQEQERLKKAMGRDFQARKNPRSPTEVRGSPTGSRVLSAREVAARLERK